MRARIPTVPYLPTLIVLLTCLPAATRFSHLLLSRSPVVGLLTLRALYSYVRTPYPNGRRGLCCFHPSAYLHYYLSLTVLSLLWLYSSIWGNASLACQYHL